MSRARWLALAALPALLLVGSVGSQSPSGTNSKTPPRLVPVAETKLLMEGIAQVNFQGLEKNLKNADIDAEGWTFARGQALLVAECGNLLMLRPPKNSGQDAWMRTASELRDNASSLSRVLATRDLARSRSGLNQLATTCNKCHQSFRVQTRLTPVDGAKP